MSVSGSALLVSVQFWNAFRRFQPDCDEQIRRGEFAPLRGWLRDQIHRHGRSLLPAEIVERVTGGSMQAGPYLDYLETKYRNL